MKLKNLFFGSLACLAFAACSNDDEPIVNNGGAQAEGDGGKYISVNIVTPALTRAMNYEDGVGAETQVDDVQLVFLSGSKILTVKTPTLTDNKEDGKAESDESAEDKWETGGTENPQVEKISQVSVYLVPSETEGNPTGIIAVLNGAEYGLDAATIKALNTSDNLLDYIEDFELKENSFLMTNSVWKENADGITDITASDFYTSAQKKAVEEGTSTDPLPVVEIYVERVLAKVKVQNAATIQYDESYNKGYTVFDKDLVSKTMYIKPLILGYHLAATTEKSDLVKSIDLDWGSENFWNDNANKRSYWAVTPTQESYGYNIFSTWQDNKASTTPVTFYCQENTSDTKTTLVVLAEHKVVENSTDIPNEISDDLESLVYCNGGYYIDLDAYKNFLARELSLIYTASDNSYDWAANLEVKHGISDDQTKNQWVIYANLKEVADVTFVKAGTTTSVELSEINTSLKTDFDAMYWQAGKAYYHVVINHDGPAGLMDKGVVRNHVYSLTVSSIKGLGSPVYDPNDDDPEDTTPDSTEPDPEIPIVPETPTYEETYVQARINVLKWRIVANQDVKLEQ